MCVCIIFSRMKGVPLLGGEVWWLSFGQFLALFPTSGWHGLTHSQISFLDMGPAKKKRGLPFLGGKLFLFFDITSQF